jgi:FkbM family methyltransferase
LNFIDLNLSYDQQTVEVMSRLLRRDSCCVDVGAHRGAILSSMMSAAPEGRHFAFEALPHLAQHLRASFQAPNVHIHEMAVGDTSGSSTFVHVVNDPGYSGLRERGYDRPDPQLQTITVSVGRIDDVIPADQAVDFIKIDIEGGEYHAMKGAQRTIVRSKPVIVFEAGKRGAPHYGVTAEDLYALVTNDLGYRLSTMRRWLSGEAPYTEDQFVWNWHHGSDFFFIAYPPARDCR